MKIPLVMDISYRLFRKHLPTAVYIFLKNQLGRGKTYFTMDHYFNLVHRYTENVDIKNKTVLEIGPGNDISTGVLMVFLGANHVYLVDRISNNRYTDHVSEVNVKRIKAFKDYIRRENLEGKYHMIDDPLEILDRITIVDCYFTDTRDMLDHIGNHVTIDVILSHTVLEHVTDLETLFGNARNMLVPNGIMFHHIDVSDHIYHILNRYSKKSLMDNCLNHMRYSHRAWRYLNDQRALNLNRRTLPYYLDLCEKYQFDIIKIDKNVLAQSKNDHFRIHPDIYKNMSDKNYSEEICSFSLLARKKTSS